MALDNYDPQTSRSAYVPSGPVNASRLAAHWTVDKYVHDMAAIGIVDFFEGEANDPTTLTGYSSSKLWLRTPAGVTDEAGDVLIWDTINSVNLASSWVALTPERFSNLIVETHVLGGPLGALSIGAFAATRTILKALDTTKKSAAYLTEAGRQGLFVWRTGDFSAHVTADTQEGRYLKADAIATTSGAWERVDPRLNVRHFGAVGDGVTSDRDAFQGAVDLAAVAGVPKHVYIPSSPNSYRILATDNVIEVSSDLIMEGGGMFSTIIERDDFSNHVSGRKDFLASDELAPHNLEFRNFQVLGEWEKPYTTDTGTWTVNYRIPGPIQLEGYVRADGDGAGTNTVGTAATTFDIKLPATASATDNYYVGAGLQIGAGTGAGTDTRITAYNGTTKIATCNGAVTGGLAAAGPSDSYIQIGGAGTPTALSNPATGFGFRLENCGDIVVENVMLRGIRNQALSINNARSVMVKGCQLYKCARGGISVRRTPQMTVTGCLLRFVGDDAIFNSQELAGSGVSRNVLIDGNILVDTFGIRMFGSRQTKISNNLIIRPMTKGIAVGPISDVVPSNMYQVTIEGNAIYDVMDRNSVVYNSPSSALNRPAAIEVFTGQGIGANATPADPTQTYNEIGQYNGATVVTPEQVANFNNTDRMQGADIVVRNNHIASYIKLGTNWSDYNADLDDKGNGGAFYHRGTLLTDGFIDDTVVADDIAFHPIKFVGPLHSCDISNNKISGRVVPDGYAAIFFQGNDTSGGQGLGADIQFNYAITKLRIKDNDISRCSEAVKIESDGLTDKQFEIEIDGNTFDCDPYFEHQSRKTDPISDLPDGTWTTANNWAIDNQLTTGLTITNNKFMNTAALVRDEPENFVNGNIVYARATAVGANSANAGVRDIPYSGEAYIVIDRDSDPLSANYLATAATLTQSNAKPSDGRYVQGHFVRKGNVSLASDGYVIGWTRLTTGTGHTLGTDWLAVTVPYTASGSGTLATGDITFTGNGPTPDATNDRNRYAWTQRGNVVTGWVRCEFAASDVFTIATFNFADMSLPAPVEPAGLATGELFHAFAGILGDAATSEPPAQGQCWFKKTGASSWSMSIYGSSVAYDLITISFTYEAA